MHGIGRPNININGIVVFTLISVLLNSLPILLRFEVPRGDLGPVGEGRVAELDTPSSSMEGDLRGLSAGRGGGESLTFMDTTGQSVVKNVL